MNRSLRRIYPHNLTPDEERWISTPVRDWNGELQRWADRHMGRYPTKLYAFHVSYVREDLELLGQLEGLMVKMTPSDFHPPV